MSKVLVTGGGGYIGSILVPMLLGKGHEVMVLDNFRYGQSSLLDVGYHPLLRIIRGDVRDGRLLRQVLADQDMIIPLACLVGAPLCELDPTAAKAINHETIIKIIKWRKPTQRIVFPNTNSGYGRMADGVTWCDENTPLEPVSLYGRLKVESEKALREAGNVIIFRLATVCGLSPRMRLDLLVNDFVYRAVTDRAVVLFEADFKRNFVHVRDVARAFLFAMDHFPKMRNEVYNVGLSEANLNKRELCELIKEQVPYFVFLESPIGKDPDQRNYVVSNKKIEGLGFKAGIGIEETIAELIKGYQVIRRKQYANI